MGTTIEEYRKEMSIANAMGEPRYSYKEWKERQEKPAIADSGAKTIDDLAALPMPSRSAMARGTFATAMGQEAAAPLSGRKVTADDEEKDEVIKPMRKRIIPKIEDVPSQEEIEFPESDTEDYEVSARKVNSINTDNIYAYNNVKSELQYQQKINEELRAQIEFMRQHPPGLYDLLKMTDDPVTVLLDKIEAVCQDFTLIRCPFGWIAAAQLGGDITHTSISPSASKALLNFVESPQFAVVVMNSKVPQLVKILSDFPEFQENKNEVTVDSGEDKVTEKDLTLQLEHAKELLQSAKENNDAEAILYYTELIEQYEIAMKVSEPVNLKKEFTLNSEDEEYKTRLLNLVGRKASAKKINSGTMENKTITGIYMGEVFDKGAKKKGHCIAHKTQGREVNSLIDLETLTFSEE